jgi:predicted amidohydrolase
LTVRLIVFPEFAHAAPVFETAKELEQKLAVEIPNEHTERLQQKANEHDLYIQSGSMLEVDPKWPRHVFNTTCLIGPKGILYKYRKVNTWIPYEVHTSPHDLATCWLICAVKPTLVIAIIFIQPRILVWESRTNKIIS